MPTDVAVLDAHSVKTSEAPEDEQPYSQLGVYKNNRAAGNTTGVGRGSFTAAPADMGAASPGYCSTSDPDDDHSMDSEYVSESSTNHTKPPDAKGLSGFEESQNATQSKSASGRLGATGGGAFHPQ